MDPLSRLPLECLQALLALLAREDHYGTLSAIVRTNKHLASTALPFLYNDPYRVFSAERRFKQEDDSDYDYIPDEYLANGHRLTRMLLRRLSIIGTTRIHKSTTLAYGIPYPASAPNTYTTRFFSPSPLSPTFDYLSYIRHLHVNPLAINLGQRFRRSRRVKAFVQDDEEFRQMCTSVLQGTESWSHATDMERIRYRRPREDPILISVFQVMFLRETTWTLAEPILEQLRSLTIPVSDVVRYRRVGVIGGRLRRLEKVRFMMDDEVCNFYAPRRSTSVSNEMVKTRRAAKMEAIVQFVKEYVQVFGSRQLREVEFVDGDEKGVGLWPDCSVYTFPTETQLEVTRLLEPLFLYQPPKLLDHKNWVNLAAHPEVSDLSKVKEVLCVEDEDERSSWRIFLGDNRDLLRNCRSLEEIKMFAISTSSFYWAVQEKRDMDKSSQLAVLEGKEEPTQDSGQGLVPLSRAIIFGSQAQMIPEVNNIAFAFSQTLTCLRAMEHSPSPEVLATETPRTTVGFSHFGEGWVTLSHLTDLYLGMSLEPRTRLLVTRDLLLHCPNVVSVHLADNVVEYRCDDIVPSLPATLNRLETLFLGGWSALTFDPATFSSTKALRKVLLTMATDPDSLLSSHFIPPIDELDRSFGVLADQQQKRGAQQQSEGLEKNGGDEVEVGMVGCIRSPWSWDWDLPVLATLILNAEFAFRFDFRMLQRCPSLEILDLNMKSTSDAHVRTITHTDLYVSQMERIVAPSLSGLSLYGLWSFEDSTVLERFLSETLPNLKHLREDGWKNVSTLKIINAAARAYCGKEKEENENKQEEDERKVEGVMETVIEKAKKCGVRIFELQRAEPKSDKLQELRLGTAERMVACKEKYLPGIQFIFSRTRARFVCLKEEPSFGEVE